MNKTALENVRVWERQRAEFRDEPVYRGGTLEFLFRHPIGRFFMKHLLSLKVINNLITWRKRTRHSRGEISPFVEYFKIDTSEFVRPMDSFTSFADFFVRELHPDARPIASGADALVSPCDGRIEWMISGLGTDTVFEVKGQSFTLSEVFSDQEVAGSFVGGSILGFYLSPFDYHRFCYPCGGKVVLQRSIGNRYFSVNEQSLAAGFRAFDCNIRNYTVLVRDSTTWAMVEVAGFFAGRMVALDASHPTKTKGTMKGYFDIGGSFILLVFPSGGLLVDNDIKEHLAKGIPVRVKLGERIGTLPKGGETL